MLMEFRLTTCELPCLEVYSWFLVTQCTLYWLKSHAFLWFQNERLIQTDPSTAGFALCRALPSRTTDQILSSLQQVEDVAKLQQFSRVRDRRPTPARKCLSQSLQIKIDSAVSD